MKKILCFLCIALLLLAGCIPKDTDNEIKPTATVKDTELPHLTGMQELKTLLGANGGYRYNYAAGIADDKAQLDAETTGGDYSQTNTQVAGVDEADIVKTDGEYIYTVTNGGIFIAKLGTDGKMTRVTYLKDFEKNFYPSEIYIDTGRLVVIGYGAYMSAYDTVLGDVSPAVDAIEPGYWWGYGSMQIYVFNTTDMSNITLSRSLKLDGSYVTSRKEGDYLYVILNQYPYFKDENTVILPSYEDSAVGEKKEIAVTDIQYLPSSTYYNFLLVAGISLKDATVPADLHTYLGNASTVYMSNDYIYTASSYWEQYENNITTTVRPDATAAPASTSAEKPDASAVAPETTPAAGSVGGSDSVSVTPDGSISTDAAVTEKDDTSTSDVSAIDSYAYKTRIYKFAANEGKITYQATGDVDGTIINQFSLDEYNGYLRIATTTGFAWGGTSANNVYVLDSNLKTVGQVNDLAKGETIYSVRFEGETGYMVTYRTVDPLFVVNLSDPANPKVEGELKIPGYSTYMHPYDENHIIGFGMDTQDMGDGRVVNNGVKMAMFDVSDPADPKELFSVTIGEAGSFSELNYNHKALLFSKEKNLIAFPINIAGSDYNYVAQGLQVYSIDMVNGRFVSKGTITHGDAALYDYNTYISRGLFVGNTLYAVSGVKITSHTMSNLNKLAELEIK